MVTIEKESPSNGATPRRTPHFGVSTPDGVTPSDESVLAASDYTSGVTPGLTPESTTPGVTPDTVTPTSITATYGGSGNSGATSPLSVDVHIPPPDYFTGPEDGANDRAMMGADEIVMEEFNRTAGLDDHGEDDYMWQTTPIM